MAVGIAGIDGDRPADQIDRLGVPPGLIGDQAKQIQAVGMKGINGQNLPVQRFALGQTAGLEKVDRGSEQLVNAGRCG